MIRAFVWSMLVMCSAAPCRGSSEADNASWTLAFVVAADCPAPTETRRALDAVARRLIELGPRLSQHHVVVLHSPATSAPPCLATTRRGAPSTRVLGRDPQAAMAALFDAVVSCPARRRALVFVGHTEEQASDRLGLPIAISALVEWVRATGGEPFDLIVLHCCYSARLETIVRLAPSARWLAMSERWIQPQDVDYRTLGHAAATDDGRALAERFVRASDRRRLLAVRADAGRLSTFLDELSLFSETLRRGLESGALDPLEIGHLHAPLGESLPNRVDVTALLDCASSAHWLPREARASALTAAKTLRDFVALPTSGSAIARNTQPVITVGFPWHEPPGSKAWQAYRTTPFAGMCAWPRLLADAKHLASGQGGRFMGWELERALVGR